MIILKIIFNLLFLIVVFIDIKTKLIPEKILIMMMIISILKLILLKNFISFYYSISIFSMPFHLILILETYLKKELIGLGDVKLMIIISSFLAINNLFVLNIFYLIMYLFSFIFILFYKPNDKYIPFAPMMYIGYLFVEVLCL